LVQDAGLLAARRSRSSLTVTITPRIVNRLVPAPAAGVSSSCREPVVRFAAESHVDRSIAGAAEFVQANAAGVQVLLDACLATGIGRVVHVSTDEVYGSIGEGSWAGGAGLDPNHHPAATLAAL
jgi:dTDP-D-glucose 4,6-dehydratase